MPRIFVVMQRICIGIATASAVFLFAPDVMVTGASAQSAAPGQPLQILKILERPINLKNKRPLAKSFTRTNLLATRPFKRHTSMFAAQRSRVIAPAQISIPPAADSAPPADDPAPTEITVAGETIQVASPDDVNAIDLAANDDAAQANDAVPVSTTTSAQTLRDITAANRKSDSLNTAPAAQPQADAVGSPSWILQVLATLGGAVTAGSIAWLLIGAIPQRTYG